MAMIWAVVGVTLLVMAYEGEAVAETARAGMEDEGRAQVRPASWADYDGTFRGMVD